MKVLVNGIGNIGTTLSNLLLEFRELLEIDAVHLNKNLPAPWLENDLALLQHNGARICTTEGSGDYPALDQVIDEIDYIFECTTNRIGLENLERYRSMPNLIGACSQGGAKGFGIPFMSGVNPESIRGEKFVTVVSCSTQATASLLLALAGDDLGNLDRVDMVYVRRSEDIGSHGRLVGASVVARHLDPVTGTHQALELVELFRSKGIEIEITASGVTTPSQLMHSARFSVDLKEKPAQGQIEKMIDDHEFLAITRKFDSNAIFELGRRYGFQGRIYSHAIVVSNNLLLSDGNVKGWMFVPQEGNTLLSTIEAFLLQTSNDRHENVMQAIKAKLVQPAW